LRPLEITSLDKLQGVVKKYADLQIPKADKIIFVQHLTQDRNAWFLEVLCEGEEVGVVYFTNVVPHLAAQMNFFFWDGKLKKGRVGVVRDALKQAFTEFKLQRVGVQMKWSNAPQKRFLADCGFVWEGTLRRGWVDPDGCHDMLLYGMLREEL
jgi:RimJ/RimL family protein N-acetyltransferase